MYEESLRKEIFFCQSTPPFHCNIPTTAYSLRLHIFLEKQKYTNENRLTHRHKADILRRQEIYIKKLHRKSSKFLTKEIQN